MSEIKVKSIKVCTCTEYSICMNVQYSTLIVRNVCAVCKTAWYSMQIAVRSMESY